MERICCWKNDCIWYALISSLPFSFVLVGNVAVVVVVVFVFVVVVVVVVVVVATCAYLCIPFSR